MQNNPAYDQTFSWDHWQLRYSQLLRFRTKRLAYAVEIVPKESEVPVNSHILSILCNKAGMNGSIALRPYLYLTEEEKSLGRKSARQIAVYCLGENSHSSVMKNKIWGAHKLQGVIDSLHKEYGTDIQILQIGGKNDPPLGRAVDLRGKTTLRESAAILSQSICCITTIGLIMHMARAVGCPSVAIYGGREHSWQSGYTCNENVDSFPECSPCWKWSACDYERKCMTAISVDDVLAAVERLIKRLVTQLETDIVII
jgi:ADP-heptose:LPS heptosyltransferase